MRIAIFSDTFPPQVDGVASVAYQSARWLAGRGHDVTVLAPRTRGRATAGDSEGFEIIGTPSVSFWGYPGHRAALPLGRVWRHFRNRAPDIVHAHTPFTLGWEALRTARRFGVPLVGTHHTFYDHYLRHVKLDYRWAKKLSWKFVVGYYNRCQHVLSPSAALVGAMHHHGLLPPISLMPNPINTELFRPLLAPRDQKALRERFGISGISVVYMGRVSYEKSIDQAIRAFAIARRQIPGLTFMIVGEGPERGRLEALAKELGVGDSVVFTGLKRGGELVAALQANDVFLTASKSEDMPVSVLEGMSVGLPVVGVRALGIPEIARHGENAMVAEPDNLEEIAAHLVALAGDGGLRKKFAGVSRRIALEYSADSAVRALEELYQNVLARHGAVKAGSCGAKTA